MGPIKVVKLTRFPWDVCLQESRTCTSTPYPQTRLQSNSTTRVISLSRRRRYFQSQEGRFQSFIIQLDEDRSSHAVCYYTNSSEPLETTASIEFYLQRFFRECTDKNLSSVPLQPDLITHCDHLLAVPIPSHSYNAPLQMLQVLYMIQKPCISQGTLVKQ